MSRIQQVYPYIILTLLTLVGLWWVFGPAFLSPNTYLLSASGDGLKAYYASEYFVRYVPEGFHHPGFQYPHGNHLLYLDANPLLSTFLRTIFPIIDLTPWTIGIITASIMISFAICAWLLFAILRRCALPVWWSVLSALAITFFSPQIVRIAGHYSLSYLFVVPLFWYLLIRYFESAHPWKWLGIYSLAVTVMSFVHPYYFLIGFLFLWSSTIVPVLQGKIYLGFVSSPYPFQRGKISDCLPMSPSGKGRGRKQLQKTILSFSLILLISLLPVIILKAWEYLSWQGATDSVKYPYGFLSYIAGFESIFLPPQYSPLWDMWNALIKVRKIGMEGYAYVGFTGLCVLGFTVGRVIYLLRKKKSRRILRPVLPFPLRGFVWAATLLLIPAMAYPFQLFPSWAEVLDFVRQFRSLGRIAWVFYYVFMVYAAWLIYAFYRKWRLQSNKIANQLKLILIPALAFIFWGMEAYWLIEQHKKQYLANPISNLSEQNVAFDQLLTDKGIATNEYQAILSLPFYHHGSEKLFLHNWISSRISMAVSLDTGLPICNNTSARVPLSYMMDAIQLVSHPAIHKALPEKFPLSKPLLLLYQKQENYRPGEALLIARSDSLMEWEGIVFARLDLDDFDDTQDEIIQTFAQQRDSLNQIGMHWVEANTSYFYFQDFGDTSFSLGNKLFKHEKGSLHLFEGTINGIKADIQLEVSFWVRIDRETNYLPALDIIQIDATGKQHKSRFPMQDNHDIYEGWVRVRAEFVPISHAFKLVLQIKGKPLTLDNLMIRPVDKNIFSRSADGQILMYNNYFIRNSSQP